MKTKLKRAITSLMVALTLVAIAPIGANAAWKSNSVGWWYQSGNSYYANGWYQIGGNNWYYFKPDGYMASNQWIQSGGQWYYLQSDGSMAHDTTINGYYLGSNGAWTTNTSSTLKSHKATGVKAGSDTAAGQRMAQNNQ